MILGSFCGICLGYVLGEERDRLWDYLHSSGMIIPGLVILVVLLSVLVRRKFWPKGYSPAMGCSVKR